MSLLAITNPASHDYTLVSRLNNIPHVAKVVVQYTYKAIAAHPIRASVTLIAGAALAACHYKFRTNRGVKNLFIDAVILIASLAAGVAYVAITIYLYKVLIK